MGLVQCRNKTAGFLNGQAQEGEVIRRLPNVNLSSNATILGSALGEKLTSAQKMGRDSSRIMMGSGLEWFVLFFGGGVAFLNCPLMF